MEKLIPLTIRVDRATLNLLKSRYLIEGWNRDTTVAASVRDALAAYCPALRLRCDAAIREFEVKGLKREVESLKLEKGMALSNRESI